MNDRAVLVISAAMACACGAFGEDDKGAGTTAAAIVSDVTVQGMVASGDRLAWLAGDKLFIQRGADAPYVAVDESGMKDVLPIPGFIVANLDDVYFSSGPVITHCVINGALCAADSPIPGLNSIGPIAVQNKTLMLTNSPGPGPMLMACPLPSCDNNGPTMIAMLGGAPTQMVATTGAVVVALLQGSTSNTSIVRYIGSDAGTLASDVKALGGLATDGTTVYWTDAGIGAVRSIPIGGGMVRDLALGRLGPSELAVDGVRLYWIEVEAGKVMACDLPDCASPVSLAVVKKPSHLTVGDRVYVASIEDRAIYAVAK